MSKTSAIRLHSAADGNRAKHSGRASSETLVEATEGCTAESLWEFQAVAAGSFRIISRYYSGKSLKANANGSVSFENTPSNTSDKSFIWYVSARDGGYYITNEQYSYGLYVEEDTSGNFTCRIDTGLVSSLEAREWLMLDYICYIKNTDLNLYLKNKTGMNYNTTSNSSVIFEVGEDNRIDAMEFLDSKSNPDNYKNSDEKAEAIGDLCGYRLVYYVADAAYMNAHLQRKRASESIDGTICHRSKCFFYDAV